MEKLKFNTWLTNPCATEPNPSGDRYANNYQEEIDEYGKIGVVVSGKTDVYAMIQSEAESCKIENILKAASLGDTSGLMQREATYVDCTSMPKTLMEAQNLVVKMKQEFYELPLEVRKEFDNSPEMYVSEMGTETFKEKLAPYNKKIADIKAAGDLEAYNTKVAQQAKFEMDVNKLKGEHVTNE